MPKPFQKRKRVDSPRCSIFKTHNRIQTIARRLRNLGGHTPFQLYHDPNAGSNYTLPQGKHIFREVFEAYYQFAMEIRPVVGDG